MRTTRSIGAVAVVAMLCATVAGGVAAATSSTANAQNAMVLYSTTGRTQDFPVSNADHDSMTINVAVDRLTNAGGTRIGRHHWQCIQSDFAWNCTGVIVLNERAARGAGTITVAGLFHGFNGESFAITGGTGAYAGAEGTVRLTFDQGRFIRTVKLLP